MEEENENNFFNEFIKRIEIMDNNSKEVNDSLNKNNLKSFSQENNFKKEMDELKIELESLRNNVNNILKAVFLIGKKLKNNVNKQQFDLLKEKVDSWPLEEYITKNELEKTFNHYAKPKN